MKQDECYQFLITALLFNVLFIVAKPKFGRNIFFPPTIKIHSTKGCTLWCTQTVGKGVLNVSPSVSPTFERGSLLWRSENQFIISNEGNEHLQNWQISMEPGDLYRVKGHTVIGHLQVSPLTGCTVFHTFSRDIQYNWSLTQVHRPGLKNIICTYMRTHKVTLSKRHLLP